MVRSIVFYGFTFFKRSRHGFSEHIIWHNPLRDTTNQEAKTSRKWLIVTRLWGDMSMRKMLRKDLYIDATLMDSF